MSHTKNLPRAEPAALGRPLSLIIGLQFCLILLVAFRFAVASVL